jgi:hypothetical protein
LKEELDDSTIVPEEFYTQFSIMNISAWQKISQEIKDLKNTVNWIDPVDAHRTLTNHLDIYSSQVCMGHFPG